MACIRKRRGKWVVDYRDGAGIRRWVTCSTRREANEVLSERLREVRQPIQPATNPGIPLGAYSKRWLKVIEPSIKPSTLRSYEISLRKHILPAFGKCPVRQVLRGRIKSFLAGKLTSGLSRNSVRIHLATLRAMLNAAVDDGLLLSNPAEKLGRQLRLTTSPKYRQEEIKAFNREQLSRFLSAAQGDWRHFSLFFTMARTGIRVGEAFGLQWKDLDYERREIRVERSISSGLVGTPKSGKTRSVDMSLSLRDLLLSLEVARKKETLNRGWREVPPWVFCTEEGTPLKQSRVGKAFKKTLKKAGLPGHFSSHSLRHTFASLLLQQGESPAYVQRQLGHASIQLTVDTYGRWLPMGNKAAVDKLDDAIGEVSWQSGSKMVAEGESRDPKVPQVIETAGAGVAGRTDVQLITNQPPQI